MGCGSLIPEQWGGCRAGDADKAEAPGQVSHLL